MTLTDTRLHDFLASIQPDGVYAILATQRMGLEWVGSQILDAQPGVEVRWGTGQIIWPDGARAKLISIYNEGSLNHLRGENWNAVLLVYGDPERPFPPSLWPFLQSIKRHADFKVWEVVW